MSIGHPLQNVVQLSAAHTASDIDFGLTYLVAILHRRQATTNGMTGMGGESSG